MEIIIQGKPYSKSKVSTSGLDSTLVDKIVDTFFESMGVIRNEKALVVDTIYWIDKWYAVYTYSRYANITDKASENHIGRQSYFALSLVIPQNFLYLTSEVYQLLDKVYKEVIEGIYISKEGQYLVQNFTDLAAFNTIVNKINADYIGSNLQDPIDSSFKKNHSKQEIRYNLLDCDSQAFLNDLKQHGRIIVGDGDDYPVKCSTAVLSEHIHTENQLQKQCADIKEQLDNSRNRINALEQDNNRLKSENLTLQQKLETSTKGYKETSHAPAPQPTPVPSPLSHSKYHHKSVEYLSIANFVLLVILCLSSLFTSMQKSGDSIDNIKMTEANRQVMELNRTIETANRTIQSQQMEILQLKDSIASLQENIKHRSTSAITTPLVPVRSKDIDCSINITNSRQEKIENGGEVDDNEMLTITWTPQKGYSWHTDNLSQEAQKRLNDAKNDGKVEIPIKCTNRNADNKQEVLIVYRTEDKQNAHPKNRITLKIK